MWVDRRAWSALGLAVVAAFTLGSALGPAASAAAPPDRAASVERWSAQEASPAASDEPSACSLPLTHDPYTGFHVAVPEGWDVLTLGGEVLVENGPQQTEAVDFLPALATNGLTPSTFFSSIVQQRQRQAQQAGSPISVQSSATNGAFPLDTFETTESGQTVSGVATVVALPLQTPDASSELVFVASWAPSDQFASEQPTLAAIAACYGPEPGALFQVFQDQAFTYAMPSDWSVADESQDVLDLHLGSDALVSYLFAGVSSSQAASSDQLIALDLETIGFTDVTPIWSVSSQPQADTTGATVTTTYEEFTANLAGVPDRGLAYGNATVGSGNTFGVVRLGVSTAARWNALNASMIQMMGYIQHDFAQDLAQIQHLNQQFQSLSGQEQAFDDVLNSQQLVQDPATGTFYEAPYAAYQVNGPGGPGYYLPSGQRLNSVQQP